MKGQTLRIQFLFVALLVAGIDLVFASNRYAEADSAKPISIWVCNNTHPRDPKDPNLTAYIDYLPWRRENEQYRLRIDEGDRASPKPIVRIQPAFFKELTRNPSPDKTIYQWVYGGRNSKVDVMLGITQEGESQESLSAMLKMGRHGMLPGYPFAQAEGQAYVSPVISEMHMICTRSEQSDK